MDFGPKSKVEEGAVVKLGGRFFAIAVSTGKFVCDGNEIMSISTQAPIYAELEGKRAGDAISFNGRDSRSSRSPDSDNTEGRRQRLGIKRGNRPKSCGVPRKEAGCDQRPSVLPSTTVAKSQILSSKSCADPIDRRRPPRPDGSAPQMESLDVS